MGIRFSWLILMGVALVGRAQAADQNFYFHKVPSPIAIPGGTSDRILDGTAPTNATPSVDTSVVLSDGQSFQPPRYTTQAFATDTVLAPLMSAEVNLSSNQVMQHLGTGCADISILISRIDSSGAATTLGVGTALQQTIPQGGQSGQVGFAQFFVTLDQTGDRTILAGEALAIDLIVANNCSSNRRIFFAYDGVSAPAQVSFGSYPAGVANCLQSIDKAIAKYTKGRYKTLAQCENKIDAAALPPQDCTAEPNTNKKLTKTAAKFVTAVVKKCTNNFVIDAPPAGLGVAACPAVTGRCGFTIASLNDGTRGNDNDYLDCLLCVEDAAVASMMGTSYATSAAPPLGELAADCQDKVAKASISYQNKALKLLQKCRKAQIKGTFGGTCPDPKTQTKITTAQGKVAATVAAACSDATVTTDLGLSTCGGPPVSCVGPIASSADEATCLNCTHTAFNQCLFLLPTGRVGTACP